jgi:hypothetical protein
MEILKAYSETSRITEKELEQMTVLSKAVEGFCFNDCIPPILVGGAGLRALERLAGLGEEAIFSGRDVDMMLMSTDNHLRHSLQEELNKVDTLPPVDVHRFITEEERGRAIFRQITADENDLILSSLFNKVSFQVEQIEVLKLSLGNSQILYCASPSTLFHLYATRIPGGQKHRDFAENKFRRLIKLISAFESEFSLSLTKPYQMKGWREFRRRTRNNLFARIIISAVDINDYIGRPWEKLGLATLIK